MRASHSFKKGAIVSSTMIKLILIVVVVLVISSAVFKEAPKAYNFARDVLGIDIFTDSEDKIIKKCSKDTSVADCGGKRGILPTKKSPYVYEDDNGNYYACVINNSRDWSNDAKEVTCEKDMKNICYGWWLGVDPFYLPSVFSEKCFFDQDGELFDCSEHGELGCSSYGYDFISGSYFPSLSPSYTLCEADPCEWDCDMHFLSPTGEFGWPPRYSCVSSDIIEKLCTHGQGPCFNKPFCESDDAVCIINVLREEFAGDEHLTSTIVDILDVNNANLVVELADKPICVDYVGDDSAPVDFYNVITIVEQRCVHKPYHEVITRCDYDNVDDCICEFYDTGIIGFGLINKINHTLGSTPGVEINTINDLCLYISPYEYAYGTQVLAQIIEENVICPDSSTNPTCEIYNNHWVGDKATAPMYKPARKQLCETNPCLVNSGCQWAVTEDDIGLCTISSIGP